MKLLLAALMMTINPLFGCFWWQQDYTIAAQASKENPIPPRYQWDANAGYCGEVSLISAGLYYGQYVSQYDARSIAINGGLQSKKQLLLGVNDTHAASQMHLNYIEWNTAEEESTPDFLVWVRQQVVQGYPVCIGIFTNEYRFYGNTNPLAGDGDYDHIVPVYAVDSYYSLNDPTYHGDDILHFIDNGLWGDESNPPYFFSYAFDDFQASRRQANAKNGEIYSLSNIGNNYGIAITGVMDLNGDTLPVRLATSVNDEVPPIKNGMNVRPEPMPLTLTITVSNLEPGVSYYLYRYDDFSSVPNSQFNAHAKQASECWPVKISTGSVYFMTQSISSDEIAVYRCVRADAP